MDVARAALDRRLRVEGDAIVAADRNADCERDQLLGLGVGAEQGELVGLRLDLGGDCVLGLLGGVPRVGGVRRRLRGLGLRHGGVEPVDLDLRRLGAARGQRDRQRRAGRGRRRVVPQRLHDADQAHREVARQRQRGEERERGGGIR